MDLCSVVSGRDRKTAARRQNHKSPPGPPSACMLVVAVCAVLSGCGQAGPPPVAEDLFYPPLPQRPRIQFLRALASAEDVEAPPTGLQQFIMGRETGAEAVASRTVLKPYGLVLKDGRLYVCDTGGSKTAVFDFKNRKYATLGQQGEHRLQKPVCVTVAPDGTTYVGDAMSGLIVVFDRNDRPLRALTVKGGITPCDVVWRAGRLYVADLKSSSILVLDPASGQVLRRIGQRGDKAGQLGWPTNIAFGPEPKGYLYVCDTLLARVQAFDAEGKLTRLIGERGLTIGKMVRPKGIALDREGRLYVADAATNSVQIYDPNGHLLLMLGRVGHDRGEMDLPAKVYISYEGIEHFAGYSSPDFRIEYLIFVTNQYGPNKVNVYGFGEYLGTVADDAPATGGKIKTPTSKPVRNPGP